MSVRQTSAVHDACARQRGKQEGGGEPDRVGERQQPEHAILARDAKAGGPAAHDEGARKTDDEQARDTAMKRRRQSLG